MIIRLEFAASKSARFPWALRLCKKIPTYTKTLEEGLEIHAIEMDIKEHETLNALINALGAAGCSAFYLDGVLVDRQRIGTLILDERKRQNLERWAEKQKANMQARALLLPNPNAVFLALLKKHGILGNPN